MGSGGYVICELNSVQRTYPHFQNTFIDLEREVIGMCKADWHRENGYLTPHSGQFGRTTILPALFDGLDAVQMAHWRQTWTVTGNQTLITGTRAGNLLPEDFKVALVGLAFPNKNQHVTEIKMQIGDRKYGRMDIEEMRGYNLPAIIFDEGYIIDEETAFDLYGYIEPGFGDTLPDNGPGGVADTIYQRIVLLGAAYYKQIDRVLGDCGAAI
ncbi:unnamed protein product [marine sediment metagenome]|uniref:Uncharacterized protein n=1 Tax=marine sediment metagenome TaxID=412755 RepID=X0VEC2_9ZZZZ